MNGVPDSSNAAFLLLNRMSISKKRATSSKATDEPVLLDLPPTSSRAPVPSLDVEVHANTEAHDSSPRLSVSVMIVHVIIAACGADADAIA